MVESVPTARQELAEYLNAWGLTALEAGAYPIAEPLFQRALALWEQELGPDHPDTATSLNNLAGLYQAQGPAHVTGSFTPVRTEADLMGSRAKIIILS